MSASNGTHLKWTKRWLGNVVCPAFFYGFDTKSGAKLENNTKNNVFPQRRYDGEYYLLCNFTASSDNFKELGRKKGSINLLFERFFPPSTKPGRTVEFQVNTTPTSSSRVPVCFGDTQLNFFSRPPWYTQANENRDMSNGQITITLLNVGEIFL